jgi:hypothetical protein
VLVLPSFVVYKARHMRRIHCDGCDEVIAPFHSRLRLDAALWRGDAEECEDESRDVCMDCLKKNPLLQRFFDALAAKPKSGETEPVPLRRRQK